MNIICAVSNQMGISFNHRRVSRDKMIYFDIAGSLDGQDLYMDTYSEALFADVRDQINVIASPDYLEQVKQDEYAFYEVGEINQEKVQMIVLYRFNRDYPSDFGLELDLSEFEKVSQSEFAGSSHDTITKEIWIRDDKTDES